MYPAVLYGGPLDGEAVICFEKSNDLILLTQNQKKALYKAREGHAVAFDFVEYAVNCEISPAMPYTKYVECVGQDCRRNKKAN